MKHLKLFENFNDIQGDLKDILQYLEDDLNLVVSYDEIPNGWSDLDISIDNGIPGYKSEKCKFQFNKNLKNILDVFIGYCIKNEILFDISCFRRGSKVFRIWGSSKSGKFFYKRLQHETQKELKEIKSCNDIPDRLIEWIKISIKIENK